MRYRLYCANLVLVLLFVVPLIVHAKIVFSAKRKDLGDAAYHIYVMEDDGSNVRRITSPLFYDHSPRWFPDGKRILFERDLSRGNGAVRNAHFYIIDATGENEYRPMKNYPEATRHPTDTYPKVSPDGKHIAFSSDRLGNANDNIYTLDLESGDIRNLTKNPEGFGMGWSFRLDWSPDGSQIVYEHEGGIDGDNLWIMNAANGSGKKRLSPVLDADVLRGAPSWSPSGRYIMYPESIWNDELRLPEVMSLVVQNVQTLDREIHKFPREFIILVGCWMGNDRTVLLSIRENSKDPKSVYNIYRYDLGSRQWTNLTNLTNLASQPSGHAFDPHWIAGSLAVSPKEKLTIRWGQLKANGLNGTR